jgi:predicted aspartyl protease
VGARMPSTASLSTSTSTIASTIAIAIAIAIAGKEEGVVRETSRMGKVVVAARIENLRDLYLADVGQIPPDAVRHLLLDDCLVDTGATMLSLPRALIDRLGLKQHRQRTARTAGGEVTVGIFEAVRLTVQGRDCVVEVCEIHSDCPPLIGQIPLEGLDFVVDPVGQRLVGNPDHRGEQMVDLFLK